MLSVSLIWAMAENRVIANKDALPWHLPDDLALFKKHTVGKAVIMGRKTFDTLKKPLPKRVNIVLTRRRQELHSKVRVATSLTEAYALAAQETDATECMVVGGADIYALALADADKLYMSLVHGEPDGDLLFPAFDRGDWQVDLVNYHGKKDNHSHAWSEFILTRKK